MLSHGDDRLPKLGCGLLCPPSFLDRPSDFLNVNIIDIQLINNNLTILIET